jgi:hypothetical protein
MTQAQINKLVAEQTEAEESMRVDQLMVDRDTRGYGMNRRSVQTAVVGKGVATAPGPITSEDELLKRMQKELALYQMMIDDIDMTMAKMTFDKFIFQKMDAYRDALCKVRNACFEILFCIDISR